MFSFCFVFLKAFFKADCFCSELGKANESYVFNRSQAHFSFFSSQIVKDLYGRLNACVFSSSKKTFRAEEKNRFLLQQQKDDMGHKHRRTRRDFRDFRGSPLASDSKCCRTQNQWDKSEKK